MRRANTLPPLASRSSTRSSFHALPSRRKASERSTPGAVASRSSVRSPERIENVDTVLGNERDPLLRPRSVDLVLMVDVYHELEYPYEMMQRIIRSLRQGGRVVLVEYRLEDPKVPIKLVHKMTARQAIREMRAVGLELEKRIDALPRQHILIFGRPGAASQPASSTASEG